MADEILDPDSIDWNPGGHNKGKTKYQHLMDGNARRIDVRDYGYDAVENFRVMLNSVARKQGLKSRAMKVDKYNLIFQVIGKRTQ